MSQEITAIIKNGKVDKPTLSCLNGLDDGYYKITIRNKFEHRTDQQNRALHLWFTQLAKELNDAGFDMKKTINKDLDIPWTSYNVKEFLWRPTQEAMLGKRSTTNIKTNEIDKVFDVINKTIGERTGVHVPFPDRLFLSKQ